MKKLAVLALGVLFAACSEGPVEAPADDWNSITRSVHLDETALQSLTETVLNGPLKVDLCHRTRSPVKPWIPISVEDPDYADHAAHGDVRQGAPVEGMPGFFWNSDCEPEEDTTAPICTSEIDDSGMILTFNAVDDLSGINSGGAFCSNCSSLSLDIDGGLTASATIVKADPSLPTNAGADFSDRAGNTTICDGVTF